MYLTNGSGTWTSQRLYSGRVTEAALAMGPDNRPHVTFTVGSPAGKVGVYYTSGPTG
jgi:hypothetical protein